MSKSIFKKGDTVYHWRYGEGKITDIYSEDAGTSHPITACFGSDNYQTFMLDGRFIKNEQPSLSFTPYDLVKRGFSQERPEQQIEEGQMVWVINKSSDHHEYIEFTMFAGYDDIRLLNPYPDSIEARAIEVMRKFMNAYREPNIMNTGVYIIEMKEFLEEIDSYE